MPQKSFNHLVLTVLFLLNLACSNSDVTKQLSSTYLASLSTDGGLNNFFIYTEQNVNGLSAYVVNGLDTAKFTSIKAIGSDSLQFSFEHFDSHIRVKVLPSGTLIGNWKKRIAGGGYDTVPFEAHPSEASLRYPNHVNLGVFEGEWAVTFLEEDGSSYPAIGVFSNSDNKLRGTFLTETGDYRFLEGSCFADSSFIISDFDGAHAFRFSAKLQADGTLKGDFYSRKTYHETFNASREGVALKDPFKVAELINPEKPIHISFPDITGKIVSLDDAKYKDKPVLLYLFGSWCPNCADESQMLKELYASEFANSDLQIIGLAFEYSGEFSSDAEMVRRYKERFNLPWEALVAGTSDKTEASELLPFIKKVTSFPTTFFIDRNHKINAVHVGFRGPGTGAYYNLEKSGFIKQINAIIK